MSVLVYYLAQQLVAARRNGITTSAAGSSSDKSISLASLSPPNLEPFLAALLFALHPVHTEAVAGIVGQAELLCAALSIPALLCYMAAANGWVGSVRAHWERVAAAMLLGLLSALTKEIGITIVSFASSVQLAWPLLPALTDNHLANPCRRWGRWSAMICW